MANWLVRGLGPVEEEEKQGEPAAGDAELLSNQDEQPVADLQETAQDYRRLYWSRVLHMANFEVGY